MEWTIVTATLSSTGTPAFFIHPAEASHGDLGMMTNRDALLALSNTGNTPELSNIILYAQENSLPIIAITSNPKSALGLQANYNLVFSYDHEACPLDCAPTTSTTLTLALGDALALSLMKARGFTADDFNTFHPGGSLGHKLLRVKDVMHKGDRIPLVNKNETIQNVLVEMSSKFLGCVGVIDEDELVGIITDGDIRRVFSKNIYPKSAEEIMTKNPNVVDMNKRISEVLNIMNKNHITSMFVLANNKIQEIIHLHDCIK